MILKALIFITAALLCPYSFASSPKSSWCFGTLGAILVAGNYSGELNCEQISITLHKIGVIEATPKTYEIYNLIYKTITQDGYPPHGGQKILLFSNKQYVGQYSLSSPPFHGLSIDAKSIVIDIQKEKGNRINFDENGPPRSVFIDEDTVKLSK